MPAFLPPALTQLRAPLVLPIELQMYGALNVLMDFMGSDLRNFLSLYSAQLRQAFLLPVCSDDHWHLHVHLMIESDTV